MELLRTLALLAVISFVPHFVWEYLHFGLYAGYQVWSGSYPVYWMATLGDVLYTLGAFALVSAFKKTYDWIPRAAFQDYLGLVAVGFCIALFVEYKGLALERWRYLPEMPIVPILNVGLTPILQMSLLLPLTVFIASHVLRFIKR